MIVTVTNSKGGVAKTTVAMHLAAFLQGKAPTALLDNDLKTRSAIKWRARCEGEFPFTVASFLSSARVARTHTHLVVDTGQAPPAEELEEAARGSDLLVIPAVPLPGDNDGLVQTIETLRAFGAENFRVLLTKVGPDSLWEVAELRELLKSIDVPVFRTEIPRLKEFSRAWGAGEIVSSRSGVNGARAWAACVALGREVLKAAVREQGLGNRGTRHERD